MTFHGNSITPAQFEFVCINAKTMGLKSKRKILNKFEFTDDFNLKMEFLFASKLRTNNKARTYF